MKEIVSNKLIVAGGFSEGPAAVESMIEVFTADGTPFDDALDIYMTIPLYLRDPEGWNKKLAEATVVGHSLGTIVTEHCAQMISSSGVEPKNPIGASIAAYHAGNGRGDLPKEDGVKTQPMIDAAKEVWNNKGEYWAGLLTARTYSTARVMLGRDQSVHHDAYFYAKSDPFGFRPTEQQLDDAVRAEVSMVELEGGHNIFLVQPRLLLGEIMKLVEQS